MHESLYWTRDGRMHQRRRRLRMTNAQRKLQLPHDRPGDWRPVHAAARSEIRQCGRESFRFRYPKRARTRPRPAAQHLFIWTGPGTPRHAASPAGQDAGPELGFTRGLRCALFPFHMAARARASIRIGLAPGPLSYPLPARLQSRASIASCCGGAHRSAGIRYRFTARIAHATARAPPPLADAPAWHGAAAHACNLGAPLSGIGGLLGGFGVGVGARLEPHSYAVHGVCAAAVGLAARLDVDLALAVAVAVTRLGPLPAPLPHEPRTRPRL
jgi:hypothetical protein